MLSRGQARTRVSVHHRGHSGRARRGVGGWGEYPDLEEEGLPAPCARFQSLRNGNRQCSLTSVGGCGDLVRLASVMAAECWVIQAGHRLSTRGPQAALSDPENGVPQWDSITEPRGAPEHHSVWPPREKSKEGRKASLGPPLQC